MAALHPTNALLLFALSLLVARRTTTMVREGPTLDSQAEPQRLPSSSEPAG